MNDRDLRERLQSAQWPEPSPDLRGRIAEIPVRPPAIAWADRVWYSRGWRLGIAAGAIAIVAIDVWGARMSAPLPALEDADTGTRQIADLVQSVGFPVDAAASIARRSVTNSRPATRDFSSLMGDDR